MTLTRDALVFGFGFLKDSRSRLAFGGDSARMRITARARTALDELERAGYARPVEPDSAEPGRESWSGTDREPRLSALALKEFGLDGPDRWPAFEPIEPGTAASPAP
mgnify:CR=1 FL=1|jgi:hypothetical protein